MLCEKCNERPASIFVKQIMNGEIKEMHLCHECAQTMEMQLSFDNFFKEMLGNLFVDHPSGIPKGFKTVDSYKCGNCGLTYDSFKKTGRFGCNECYNKFRNQLSAVFKTVQGSSEHQGKIPHKSGAAIISARKIENLKQALSKAIEQEEYEEAARLRDEIKSLKEGDING